MLRRYLFNDVDINKRLLYVINFNNIESIFKYILIRFKHSSFFGMECHFKNNMVPISTLFQLYPQLSNKISASDIKHTNIFGMVCHFENNTVPISTLFQLYP